MALCMPASEFWPRLKIVSLSINPVTVLGVYYWASSALRRNGYTDWGTPTCASRTSPPSVRSLVGLTLQSFGRSNLLVAHQNQNNNSNTSRMKKRRPTARPRCLVDRALHRSAEHASQRPQFTVNPAVHHRSPPTGGLFTKQQYSTKQLQQSQPLLFIADLRPVSRASSGISKPAANRLYAATQLLGPL